MLFSRQEKHEVNLISNICQIIKYNTKFYKSFKLSYHILRLKKLTKSIKNNCHLNKYSIIIIKLLLIVYLFLSYIFRLDYLYTIIHY